MSPFRIVVFCTVTTFFTTGVEPFKSTVQTMREPGVTRVAAKSMIPEVTAKMSGVVSVMPIKPLAVSFEKEWTIWGLETLALGLME